ncbi:hypothetical protein LPJ74_003906 [Coemansia sp. RSA 1843]|nr:hypothetical protein LPJ74_003906 [Coemansia sp. RSA 1843]
MVATHSLMQQQQQQQFAQAVHPVPPLPQHQYPHSLTMPHHHQQQQQQHQGMPRLVSPSRSVTNALPQSQQQPQHAPLMELKPNFYNPYHVKHRRRTSKDQLALLEGTFKTTPKPSSDLRKQLATALHMSAREVQIWFQNRRAKQKNMMLRAGNNSSTAAASTSNSSTKANESAASSPTTSPVDTAAAVSSSALISALLPSASKQQMFARASSAEHAAASSQQHTQQLKSSLTAPASALASSSSGFGLKDGIAPAPPHALRRHSDIPASYVCSGQSVVSMNAPQASTASAPATACASSSRATAATTHNGPPIEELHMPSAATTALAAVTSSATASAAADCTSPPPSIAFAAAMAAANAFASMPPVSPHGILRHQQQHSNAYGMTSPPRSALQVPMQLSKKQKKAGSGSGADSFHIARVHHEAFDGTNKLPLKPDDLSPHSADDQFHLLDPANLPNFMMPGASSTPSMFGNSGGSNSNTLYGGIGGGCGPSGLGSLVSGPLVSQQQSNANMPAGPNPGLYWDAPYSSEQQQQQQQQQGLLSSQPMPHADMSLLFSGLLGLNSSNMCSSGLSVATTMAGIPQPSSANGAVSTDSAMSPPDSAISADAAASLYHTLLSLTQQNSGTMHQQQHDSAAVGNSYNSHEMSPVSSVGESIAMASPALHSSSVTQPPPLVHARIGGKQQGGSDCSAAMFIPNTSSSFPQLIASGIADTNALETSGLFSASSNSPTRGGGVAVMASKNSSNSSSSTSVA